MAMNLDNMIDKVVLFLVIVALVPSALVSYFNVSTTGWDADYEMIGLFHKHNHHCHLGHLGDNLHSWAI